ncbi:MAG TPA: hypothetical protein VH817_18905 [Thermoleophilaceae bacterium]
MAEGLDIELGELHPDGVTGRARLDAVGLLTFEVRVPRESRSATNVIVRRYEQRALETCESCGEPGSIRAGVALRVLCNECAD